MTRPTPPSSNLIDAFGATHVGNVRTSNQDAFMIATFTKQLSVAQGGMSHGAATPPDQPDGDLFAVADGMGGHAAGHKASALAIHGLCDYMMQMTQSHRREAAAQRNSLLSAFRESFAFCQRRMRSHVERHSECRGMATTMTAAYLTWPHLFVLHAGDTRCYLSRAGKMRRLTTDHTIAQRLIDAGKMSPAAAVDSRLSHCVWNAISATDESVVPDGIHVALESGDTLMLCSDRLTKHVSDEQLAVTLATHHNAMQLCDRLIYNALAGGGRDNVTVIVVRVARPTDSGMQPLLGRDSATVMAHPKKGMWSRIRV